MKRAIFLLTSLVLGLVIGGVLHEHRQVAWLHALIADWLNIIGQVFLRLIFMIVVPLVASALILGVYELGASHGLGRVMRKTLAFTIIASSTSVFIGVVLVNIVRPGVGVMASTTVDGDVAKIESQAQAAKPVAQTIIELIPRNPVEAAANAFNGEFIAFMVFCLIAGIALSVSAARESAKHVLIPLLEQILAICLKIVEFAMAFAPLAVFALVLNASFKHGFGILANLASYAGVVVLGLLIQQVVVYSIMLRAFGKRSPLAFYKSCREVILYAFSTSSSNATLPKALETAETKLQIPPRIARFVLTIGSTANQNGTALFEGVTVLFLAQVYGVELTTAQQVQIIIMSIIAGIGTAGVPGGSLPLIMILLQQNGIPAEGMGLVLGVDRFLDMCRTVTNVTGDLVIAAIVGRDEPAQLESEVRINGD